MKYPSFAVHALAAVVLATVVEAAPVVRRLTPPSNLFSSADPNPPYISRFLPEQRFDLQATVSPDPGETITGVLFEMDGVLVPGAVAVTPATVVGLPVNTIVATMRAHAESRAGVHQLRVTATQSDGQVSAAQGNLEVVSLEKGGKRVRNLIVAIGDGMGIAHRTAARIMLQGVRQGKSNALLAMDRMPVTGLVTTHSLNSIVTDSSPGAACYSTGNKSNNNQHGVFPDDTTENFDNPRVELMTEYLRRTVARPRGPTSAPIDGAALGIVTTSDVFDATPGAFGSHTQSRGAGTGICDQYLDDRGLTGLKVLLGGGRKWFLPNTTPGSARGALTDYVLPADLVTGWGAAPGLIDPARDLLQDFQNAGFSYVADSAQLAAVSPATDQLLGLFALSNMNVALDKVGKRRGTSTVVDDYGFPDQPMLDEMVATALQVLSRSRDGFVLMFEGASIDKQAHNMDTERWILDTIEFDRAIELANQFAAEDEETLVVVTADHECAGVNIIGGSRVTNADLVVRAASGGGAGQLRTNVVGTYDAAGFPSYAIAADGYPTTTDIDRRMLIGYAANGDRFEDWLTNPQPLRDTQQPFNGVPPLSTYPTGPLNRDTAGNFMVTGQVADQVAAHTGSDIPVSALGLGAYRFTGVMDNTDVFFKMMQAAVAGSRKSSSSRDVLPPRFVSGGALREVGGKDTMVAWHAFWRTPVRTLVWVAATAASATADTRSLPAARDNTLCEDTTGSLSNGLGQHLFAGLTRNFERRRALLRFDLSVVPPGSTVTRVALSLHLSMTQTGAESVALHRLDRDWGEGTADAPGSEGQCTTASGADATWVHAFSPIDPWVAAGGDFAAAASAAQIVVDVGTYTWGSTVELVADVQGWVDNAASNFGWSLVGNEVTRSAKRFDSRENPDPNARPILTVEYVSPVGFAIVYEFPAADACLIVAPGNAVAQGTSRIDFAPRPGPLLFYQADADAACATASPPLLRMGKGGIGVVAEF